MGTEVGVVCVVGVGPDRGGRERNEDAYLVCRDGRAVRLDHDELEEEDAPGEGVLVAVFDGMGGHEAGQEASALAARALRRMYREELPRDLARALRRYVLEAHRRLHWEIRDRGPVEMGTTLTACWLVDDTIAWTNVGDSRLYLLRGGHLTQISADHTAHEFARRDGVPQDGPDHLVQSFIFGSRGLGDNTSLRLEPGLDAGSMPVERGDRLLLCSDGVWGSLDGDQLTAVLHNALTAQEAAAACVERAIARGSTDNLTALVLDVRELEEPSDPSRWAEDEDDATWQLG